MNSKFFLAAVAFTSAPFTAQAQDPQGEQAVVMGPYEASTTVQAQELRISSEAAQEAARNAEAATRELQETIENAKGLTFFGAGPSVTLNLSNRDRVDEAHLDENGIIRLTQQSDASVGIFLEAHYLWETEGLLPFIDGPCKSGTTKCGFGPFVGVQPGGSSEIIEGIGAGIMWGLKGTGDNFFNSTQFTVGLGVFVDPSVQTLGAGQFQDQALPVGETEIRYQEDFQANFMIIFTVNPF